MSVPEGRHEEAAAELREWWEDLWQQGIGSQLVVLKAPPGWGQHRVLECFASDIRTADSPFTVVIPVHGRELSDGVGLQAEEVRRRLVSQAIWREVAELLDVDSPAGQIELAVEVSELALEVAKLLAPPVGVPLAVTRVVITLRKLYERRSTRTAGTTNPEATRRGIAVVARTARALARVSKQLPVVLLIDEAERIEVNLALALLENLMFRWDGKVLAVVATAPDSKLAEVLRDGDRVRLAGRVHTLGVDTDMSNAARSALAKSLHPALPEPIIKRIGDRTGTFDEVFRVCGSKRLRETSQVDGDPAEQLAVLDAVIDITLNRGQPEPEAVLVAWAGGMAHPRQVAVALAAAGDGSLTEDPDLRRSESVIRLADPSAVRFNAPVMALLTADCRSMAAEFLTQATEICADPGCGLLDRVVAGRAAHHVRQFLDDERGVELVRMQLSLVADLEVAGDLIAAYKVASEAWNECPQGDEYEQYRQQVEAAKVRLAMDHAPDQDPLVAQLTREAMRDGAIIGLESRVWTAVNLLRMPGQTDAALNMIDQARAELDSRADLGDSELGWRLLLAFWAGRAGHHSAAQQLLAPLLSSPDGDVQSTASRVGRAIEDPFADDRLQIETLESELATDPTDEDDLLGLHAALSRAHGKVGDFRRAREHALCEVRLRERLQGREHPDTLIARKNLASRIGEAGEAAMARDEFAALLPALARVVGLEHPETLTARSDLTSWVGEAGDVTQARDDFAALLPTLLRVFGPEHLVTLNARSNLAAWTGEAGDAAGARDQLAALLPDRERVLGPEHPRTLAARISLATWIATMGDASGARDHYAALMPVLVRVLGPEHSDTLKNRSSLAAATGAAGDAAGARDQCAALAPVCERLLGPEHPDTLSARSGLASWTGATGDAAAARDQFAALLPVVTRTLGPDHPETLATRSSLATYTGDAGDAAEARDQFAALLPDRVRVLGPEHPDTLTTRNNLAAFTGEAGDATGARDQLAALVPALARVLGSEHPHTLAARNNLAAWTKDAGDAAGARDQLAALVPALARELGPEHPVTLSARNNLAASTGAAGDAARARDQLAALLPVITKILGSAHPHTLAAQDSLQKWELRSKSR
jgi:hypothetical protein